MFFSFHLFSDGQYLSTIVLKYVFKYISVFKNVFLDTLQNRYLNTVFNYIFEYLNTMYLNALKFRIIDTYHIYKYCYIEDVDCDSMVDMRCRGYATWFFSLGIL